MWFTVCRFHMWILFVLFPFDTKSRVSNVLCVSTVLSRPPLYIISTCVYSMISENLDLWVFIKTAIFKVAFVIFALLELLIQICFFWTRDATFLFDVLIWLHTMKRSIERKRFSSGLYSLGYSNFTTQPLTIRTTRNSTSIQIAHNNHGPKRYRNVTPSYDKKQYHVRCCYVQICLFSIGTI
jgi:hypothetical protein